MAEYIWRMTDAETPPEPERWLVEHGYDGRDLQLCSALTQAASRLTRALTDEECHRVVEAVLSGTLVPPPHVRH